MDQVKCPMCGGPMTLSETETHAVAKCDCPCMISTPKHRNLVSSIEWEVSGED